MLCFGYALYSVVAYVRRVREFWEVHNNIRKDIQAFLTRVMLKKSLICLCMH